MTTLTQRLDKYLSHLGIASRRNIKSLLKNHIVTVNGKRVRESGTRIDPHIDDIRINGNKIKQPQMIYYMLHKPLGVISTTSDEFNRQNVTSLIPTNQRIYPIGRLDKDTSGLILLTNDGELTNRLTHPTFHVSKVYKLKVKSYVSKEQLAAFEKGILLQDGITQPAGVLTKKVTKTHTLLEVTLHEGRNRQIRRMCETVGITLLSLHRMQFGSLKLGDLRVGSYRELTQEELSQLKNIAKKRPSSQQD